MEPVVRIYNHTVIPTILAVYVPAQLVSWLDWLQQHRRMLIRITVTTFLILLLLQLTVPLLFTSSDPMDPSSQQLRIMTYNTHDGNLLELVPDLAELHLDVLALQEIDGSPHDNLSETLLLLAADLDMTLVDVADYPYQLYGMALLTRLPILSSSYHDLTIVDWGDDIPTPRSMIMAMVDTPQGQLQLISTHLNTPNFYTTRARQLDRVLDFYNNSQSTVLLGDFNTPAWLIDYTYDRLSVIFEDAWVVAGNHPSSGKTWHADLGLLRVDYIWVTDDIGVVTDSAQLYDGNSDHHGLLVDVVLSQ